MAYIDCMARLLLVLLERTEEEAEVNYKVACCHSGHFLRPEKSRNSFEGKEGKVHNHDFASNGLRSKASSKARSKDTPSPTHTKYRQMCM